MEAHRHEKCIKAMAEGALIEWREVTSKPKVEKWRWQCVSHSLKVFPSSMEYISPMESTPYFTQESEAVKWCELTKRMLGPRLDWTRMEVEE